MKKEFYLYPSLFVISWATTSAVGFFVPPIYFTCHCLYNTLKNTNAIIGSFIATVIILLYVRYRVKNGGSYILTFSVALVSVSIIFIVFNFAILFILR